jgi:hypothetical protein
MMIRPATDGATLHTVPQGDVLVIEKSHLYILHRRMMRRKRHSNSAAT